MQGSDATARALKATRERLKQLNAQQSDARASAPSAAPWSRSAPRWPGNRPG
ncbi:hypothetical protein P4123_26120 [Pseudomonas aeruginosa]|nr:hypothetical protein [Pseudomonas aeruginosa]